jgi:hypothetical protein
MLEAQRRAAAVSLKDLLAPDDFDRRSTSLIFRIDNLFLGMAAPSQRRPYALKYPPPPPPGVAAGFHRNQWPL